MKTNQKSGAIFLAIFVATLFPCPTTATKLRAFSFTQLVREADRIVIGIVSKQWYSWNQEHDTLYTYSVVKVIQVVKGDQHDVVVLKQIGGKDTKTQREMLVPGTASLKPQEEVLVFLRDYGKFCTLVGMKQGKWSIREIRGKKYAYRGAQRTGPLQPGEQPLEDLVKRIQKITNKHE